MITQATLPANHNTPVAVPGQRLALDSPSAPPMRLHRLRTVRIQEGFSRKMIARRLKITGEDVLRQECETNDLPISVLRGWQRVLDVPLAELLEEPEDGLSLPLLKRARLVQIMKTVNTIQRLAKQRGVQNLTRMLREQLIQIMPELDQVNDWPIIGHRRSSSDLGITAHRQISDAALEPLEQ
jgi:transcriptional regulator with XRE-family HTH domain